MSLQQQKNNGITHFSLIWFCLIFFVTGTPFSSAHSQNVSPDAIQNENQYFESLTAADSTTFKRQFELPFLLILHENEKKDYTEMDSLEDRKSYIETYWKIRNPNPILPENEWLMEFIHRYNHVHEHFPSPDPPYFDDRGKYYLKYGEPTNRYKDSGGQRTVRLFKDRVFYQHLRQLYRGFPPSIYYMVYPNESWSYRSISEYLVIHFVKKGKDYNEVSSLSKALSTGIRKNIAWYWNDLIQYRAHLSPSLGRLTEDLLRFESELLTAAHNRRGKMMREGSTAPHQRIMEKKSVVESKIAKNNDQLPSSVYYPTKTLNKLDFYNDIVQFADSNNNTKIAVSMLAPIKDNIFQKYNIPGKDTVHIDFQCMLRDSKYDSVLQIGDTTKFPLQFYESQNFPNIVGDVSLLAAPQTGDLTVQIHDQTDDRKGFTILQPFTVQDFSGHNLMISDIQFWTEPENTDVTQFLPHTEKHNVSVIPYYFREIHKSFPLYLYFEVYNLKNACVSDEYVIEMKIEKEKEENLIDTLFGWLINPKETSLGITQTRPITENRSDVFFAIDVGNLENARYQLEVTVQDKSNEQIKTSTRKEITIVE